MQKSFVVKATLCIEECQFYLRAGDVIMYESVGHRLTVYRANEIVKTLKQTPLGISAMVKTGILQEVIAPSPVAVPAPAKLSPAIEATPQTPPKPSKKTGLTAEEFTPAVKRGKAQPKEVSVDQLPTALQELV
jgi:hypothetical protein